MKKIPKNLQAALWSYDLDKLDIEKDKKLIITQVLNYGILDDVKWLYSAYSENEIKKVVENPARGRWFAKTLNFWLTVLEIKIPPEKKTAAIQKIAS